MYRQRAAILLSALLSAPALAAYTPFYAGAQLDNKSVTGLIGYQIDKTWAIEGHASRFSDRITQAGATNETQIYAAGLSALYLLPAKLDGGSSYYIFAKAGYERRQKDVTYSFPSSVTYSGSYTNFENGARFGIGAQYDFYEHLSGRTGIDISGPDRSVYMTAIFKF